MDVLGTVEILKRECDKLLDYYEDIIDNPELLEPEKLIESIENYINQLPHQYRDGVRDALSTYLSNKTAVGMCYAVIGNNNLTTELIIKKMIQRIEEDGEICCENELVLDSYCEFMQSLAEYVYYKYTYYANSTSYIDLESMLTVLLNMFDVVTFNKNTYYYDDITVDLDEFLHFVIPDNQNNEKNYHNMLNPETPKYVHNMYNISDLLTGLPTTIWEKMLSTFNQSINELLSIDGFVFTEGNRDAVCEYIMTSLMRTYYLVVFNVDVNNLNNMEAIECANKLIFNYPGHIDINNFLEELKLASRPYIDLFIRLIFKITFVVNTGFVNYSDIEKIESILRLKRGFENEIYYNSGNLRKNKVTRRIPIRSVQRHYSGAQQYIHASKCQ